jgi:hypothetical protein
MGTGVKEDIHIKILLPYSFKNPSMIFETAS